MVTLANGLVVICFFGSALFVLTYGLTARWWGNEIGRSLMAVGLAEVCLLGLSVLTIWFGPFPGSQVLALLVIAFFTAVIWWRWAAYVRTLSRELKDHEKA